MAHRPVHQPPPRLHPAIQAIKEDGLSRNDKTQFPAMLLTHSVSVSKELHSSVSPSVKRDNNIAPFLQAAELFL